jgi:phosphoribosylcarboxyaminoimidazole (NCAIR) mutase
MLAFERNRLMQIQKAARCFLSNWKLKFKKQVVVIHKKLHKMKATVWRSSHRGKFLIGKKGDDDVSSPL